MRWFSRTAKRRGSNSRHRITAGRALRLERLESKRMMATLAGLGTTNQLVLFDSEAPAEILRSVRITGLQGPRETIFGIDFRPATGELFAASRTNLYTVDVFSGQATLVGELDTAPVGNAFGVDFNPTVDRLRMVSDRDQNLRINPDTAVVIEDADLAFGTGDENEGRNPSVVASAYTNNVPGATTTTLYGIDFNRDILVTQTPANDGLLQTVGSLGLNTARQVGFDIDADGTAFASLTQGGRSRLYTIDLSSGEATLVGNIGRQRTTLIDIAAVLPAANPETETNTFEFARSNFQVNEAAGTMVITVLRRGNTTEAASVDFATADGSARAGQDYLAATGTLDFASGEIAKSFVVEIRNDRRFEGREALALVLSNPVGDVELDARATALLTILDDDRRSRSFGGDDEDDEDDDDD